MAGLLDNPYLAGSLGLLAAGGPSNTPVSLGQGLFSGYGAARQTMLENLRQKQLEQAMSVDQTRQQAAQQQLQAQQEQERRRRAFEAAAPGFLANTPYAGLAPYLNPGQVAGLLTPPKPDLTTNIKDYQFDRQNGYTGDFHQWLLDKGKAGATSVTNVLPGTGFQPNTPEAKLYTDLIHLQTLPPSPERDAAIAKIQDALSTQPKPGAEQLRAEGKIGATGQIAQRFNDIAAAMEKNGIRATGPWWGRYTRFKVGMGIGSTNEARLYSMEAQMRTQLGTALSGAAIPQSEWPSYEAQVPLLSDEPAVRAGKLAAFGPMLADLKAAARRRGPTNPAYQPGATPVPPTGGPDLSGLSDEQLHAIIRAGSQ